MSNPEEPEGVAGPGVLTTLMPGFVGTTLPDWLAARLRSGLGAVCLFGPNIVSTVQLRALTDAIRAANPRALIALDEEGGDVTRLFADVGSPSPGNAVLGRVDDLATTREAARQIGEALARTGCTVNFAPSVDVNSRADNPVIGTRSFGADPGLVARHGAAWVEGLQSTGVAATAKHFPGHGDTSVDSHVSLPVVDRSPAELRERELVPFAAAVGAGARLVMTSHLVVPQVDAENPATMSRALLVDLLRGELGFTGVVVSDALDMAGARGNGGAGEAAVRSLAGGCDLLCLGTETTDEELTEIERAVAVAVDASRLDPDRVDDASARVLALAADLAGIPSGPPPADDGPVDDAPVVALDVLAGTFDVGPEVDRWRREAEGRYAVVRLESTANMAVGPTPWGPFAAAAADPADPTSAAFSARPVHEVTPASPLPELSPDVPLLVLGRDIHRHDFARAAIDRLRERHHRVLVVDLGWPGPDRRYADVATYGGSRLMGQALLAFLADGVST